MSDQLILHIPPYLASDVSSHHNLYNIHRSILYDFYPFQVDNLPQLCCDGMQGDKLLGILTA